jgi:hypothetical protein
MGRHKTISSRIIKIKKEGLPNEKENSKNFSAPNKHENILSHDTLRTSCGGCHERVF